MPFSKSPFFEVQGLALCPADDHPNEHCSVPDEGEWFALYHLLSEQEGRHTLALAMESDSPIYDKYEDFRLVKPVALRLERWLTHEGYAWERDVSKPPRRRKTVEPEATASVPPPRGKKGKKR